MTSLHILHFVYSFLVNVVTFAVMCFLPLSSWNYKKNFLLSKNLDFLLRYYVSLFFMVSDFDNFVPLSYGLRLNVHVFSVDDGGLVKIVRT